jgi:hypothetical protein
LGDLVWHRFVEETGMILAKRAQNDLYGVLLEDVDSDGQVEIIFVSQLTTEPECHGTGYPPHCWFEFDPIDHVYKWNGAEFVFWGELPQE